MYLPITVDIAGAKCMLDNIFGIIGAYIADRWVISAKQVVTEALNLPRRTINHKDPVITLTVDCFHFKFGTCHCLNAGKPAIPDHVIGLPRLAIAIYTCDCKS